MSNWYAYVALVAAGFLPNEMWRMLGLWLGAGLREDSPILDWVKAIAAATLAGVIAQMVLAPPGALAEVPLWVRLASVGGGLLIYFLARRSLFIGTISGELILIAGKYFVDH